MGYTLLSSTDPDLIKNPKEREMSEEMMWGPPGERDMATVTPSPPQYERVRIAYERNTEALAASRREASREQAQLQTITGTERGEDQYPPVRAGMLGRPLTRGEWVLLAVALFIAFKLFGPQPASAPAVPDTRPIIFVPPVSSSGYVSRFEDPPYDANARALDAYYDSRQDEYDAYRDYEYEADYYDEWR
jgi:hypothetical protein